MVHVAKINAWLVYPCPQKQLGVSEIRQKMLANFSLKGNY